MTDYVCKICKKRLMSDEIALYRKIFSRGAKEYMCLDCQAKYLKVNCGCLEKVIERYHKSGTCVLFAKCE